MITKERALDAARHGTHLAQIYELEPDEMAALYDMVRIYCDKPSERWQNYELLKRSVRNLVGRDAKRSELRTAAHYEVLLAYIDWLLPESEEA